MKAVDLGGKDGVISEYSPGIFVQVILSLLFKSYLWISFILSSCIVNLAIFIAKFQIHNTCSCFSGTACLW